LLPEQICIIRRENFVAAALRSAWSGGQGGIHRAAFGLGGAVDHTEVLGGFGLKLGLQVNVGLVGFGYGDRPGGVFV
jgi:hypothetical protein